jgi:hypothetical protein
MSIKSILSSLNPLTWFQKIKGSISLNFLSVLNPITWFKKLFSNVSSSNILKYLNPLTWFSLLFSHIAAWFVATRVWRAFASHISADFTFRLFGYPNFPMVTYFQMKKIVAANPEKIWAFTSADLNSFSWRLTHLMTGDQWGHAGIVILGDDGELYIWQVKKDGREYKCILDQMRECDHMALGELPISAANLPKAWARLKKLTDPNCVITYDYTFNFDQSLFTWLDDPNASAAKNITMYCSAFVYGVAGGLCDISGNFQLNRFVVPPDDIYKGMIVRCEA